MSTNESNSNKALDRSLRLLEIFANDGTSMTVSDISRFLGITRITAQSIVNSLEGVNFIEKDPDSGKYSLGYQMFTLGNKYIYRYPFLHAAEKHVTNFSLENKIKVNVSVLKPEGYLVILLSKDLSLIPIMAIGNLIPVHAGASGKLLLSYLPEEKRTAILDVADFKRFTEFTITDRNVLCQQLENIRQQNYAMEVEELSLQRGCIAAPIFDISGTAIAAVSASCNAERIRNNADSLINGVVSLGRAISSELGYAVI